MQYKVVATAMFGFTMNYLNSMHSCVSDHMTFVAIVCNQPYFLNVLRIFTSLGWKHFSIVSHNKSIVQKTTGLVVQKPVMLARCSNKYVCWKQSIKIPASLLAELTMVCTVYVFLFKWES